MLGSRPLAGARDVAGSTIVGEPAVVMDVVRAARQDVEKEAADELAGVERYCSVPGASAASRNIPYTRTGWRARRKGRGICAVGGPKGGRTTLVTRSVMFLGRGFRRRRRAVESRGRRIVNVLIRGVARGG
jgi:hypothetical protein